MLESEDADTRLHTFKACCLFYMGHYAEAEKEASLGMLMFCWSVLFLTICFVAGTPSRLQIRLLFHISHRLNDENKLMIYHQKLQDSIEDQLSLSAIHALRGHYQEAIDIYKRILIDNRYDPDATPHLCL